ncbi:MAG: hypothetical protein GY847_15380 [Proteobacteria bacterium]|nr:hypothetical protein [Pseudomonadota bacterium]
MSIRTIVIDEKPKSMQPIVKLSSFPPGNVWDYAGFMFSPFCEQNIRQAYQDLNTASQAAAKLLAAKVSGRQVRVELIIDPLLPPIKVEKDLLIPILSAIAENASASVEPGPSTVILRTWWRDRYAGVDAVGIGGCLPDEIRHNLMRPGFSTRVAEWDTGFGLHDAAEAAQILAARVELFEPEDGIGFRLAIPIKGDSVLDPAEAIVGLDSDDEQSKTKKKQNNSWPCVSPWNSAEVSRDVCNDESINA